jgi:hypothetical protein
MLQIITAADALATWKQSLEAARNVYRVLPTEFKTKKGIIE